MPAPSRPLLDLARRVDRWVGWLSTGAMALAALSVLASLGLVVYGVAWRYLLNRPQTWPDELVGYLLVLLVMLGGAEVLRRDEHIGVDLLTARMRRRGRRWASIGALLAVALTGALLVQQGIEMVAFSRMVDMRSTGYLDAPMWLVQSLVPLGGGLLLLAALARLGCLLLDDPATDESAEGT